MSKREIECGSVYLTQRRGGRGEWVGVRMYRNFRSKVEIKKGVFEVLRFLSSQCFEMKTLESSKEICYHINRKMKKMDINSITGDIIDIAVKLHRAIGPGLLENVYEALLEVELKKRGHLVERQKELSIDYEDVHIENAYRMDMVVDNEVIVELKSTEKMHAVYPKQLKTYLVLANKKVGLLLNFGLSTMKNGIVRVVNKF